MDWTKLLQLLPIIMSAISTAKGIVASKQSGTSVVDIIQNEAEPVLNIFQQIGSTLFPNLPSHQQVQAAAVTLDVPTVTLVQTQLNTMGASPQLTVDGHYGQLTKSAVTAFQSANGITADGWAGPATQTALAAAVAKAAAPKA